VGDRRTRAPNGGSVSDSRQPGEAAREGVHVPAEPSPGRPGGPLDTRQEPLESPKRRLSPQGFARMHKIETNRRKNPFDAAGRRRVWFKGREELFATPTKHFDSLQRLFPPPKTHTSRAATGPVVFEPRVLFFSGVVAGTFSPPCRDRAARRSGPNACRSARCGGWPQARRGFPGSASAAVRPTARRRR